MKSLKMTLTALAMLALSSCGFIERQLAHRPADRTIPPLAANIEADCPEPAPISDHPSFGEISTIAVKNGSLEKECQARHRAAVKAYNSLRSN